MQNDSNSLNYHVRGTWLLRCIYRTHQALINGGRVRIDTYVLVSPRSDRFFWYTNPKKKPSTSGMFSLRAQEATLTA